VTTADGASDRERALSQQAYAAECERFLDFWYAGSAQKRRLQRAMIRRGGLIEEALGPEEATNNFADDSPYVDDDGKDIANERTELATVRYLKKICKDVGVLYASEDLKRTYVGPNGDDEQTRKTMEWYQSPERGNLTAQLHLVDPWLIGLQVVGLLGSYVEDLGEISYEVLPPHWFHIFEHDRWPLKLRLAFAMAYAESSGRDDDGKPVVSSNWAAYVRPVLADDPDDAPTRFEPFMSEDGEMANHLTGRYVRWKGGNLAFAEPWPIPDPGDPDIIEDGPNPLVRAGGWADGRRVWQPIVVHSAEPFVEGVRLPVADDLANTNSELDQGVTEALHTANLQLRGIDVLTGPGASNVKKIGPQNPVRLETTDSSYDIKSPQGKPLEHMDTIHRIVQLNGMLHQLPVDSLSLKPPSITTGPALMLRRTDLTTERKRRIVDAVRPESRRFDLERVLHNAHGVNGMRPAIPWDQELVVHWGELATPVDRGTRLDELDKEMAMGITSTEEALMEMHNVDLEAARMRLEKMAETKAVDVDPSAAYTGIQIEKMLLALEKVGLELIDRESAIEVLTESYPIDRDAAERIMGATGKTFFVEDTDADDGPGLADSGGAPREPDNDGDGEVI
jgi:hypothetical protein